MILTAALLFLFVTLVLTFLSVSAYKPFEILSLDHHLSETRQVFNSYRRPISTVKNRISRPVFAFLDDVNKFPIIYFLLLLYYPH